MAWACVGVGGAEQEGQGGYGIAGFGQRKTGRMRRGRKKARQDRTGQGKNLAIGRLGGRLGDWVMVRAPSGAAAAPTRRQHGGWWVRKVGDVRGREMGQVPERREQRAESVEGRERESGEKGER